MRHVTARIRAQPVLIERWQWLKQDDFVQTKTPQLQLEQIPVDSTTLYCLKCLNQYDWVIIQASLFKQVFVTLLKPSSLFKKILDPT